MLFPCRKSEQKDLPRRPETNSGEGSEQELKMNPKDCDELIESVREAGRIHRGQAKPSRKFVFKPEDVQAIRRGKMTPGAEPAVTLESLVEQITDENRHDEVETGTRVGDEV
jgi:hypothetical protein